MPMNLDSISNSEIKAVIEEYIHKERDRKIIARRLIDGVCYEPLAEEFDLSVTAVKTICYRCLDRISKHLKC